MEITFDDITKVSEPYQTFLDSIKSPETKRRYRNFLHDFLKLIPSQIYQEFLQKLPKDREPKTLASCFLDLAKKNPQVTTRIIAQFIKNLVELVQKGEMSPNTLPNHVKPIKAFLDSNGVPLHWKSLYKQYPRARPAADDRAYTREELQKMLEISTDITDKIIIQMFSAGGFRLESWNFFTWKDLVFFKNPDGSYKGAALLIYHGDLESYWTFLTPECCKTLEIYRESWRSQLGRYPRPEDPLLKSVKSPFIRRLNGFGRSLVQKQGLLQNGASIGMRMRISDNLAVWYLYGNLDDFDFENEAIKIVKSYKEQSEQNKENKNKKEPVQITETVPNSVIGLGTYFYPPILIGEIKPTLQEQIENRTYELLDQKALLGEFDGIKFVISKGGLIGLETIDHEKAENILNIVMGVAILMGLPLHALKSNEIANITIDRQTYDVTGSTWTESTFRMMLFYIHPLRNIHHSRTKITPEDLENVIEKAKNLAIRQEHFNKLKLLLGAYTHLDNHEFSQSFIMAWTLVEIHIHELWNKIIQSSGVPKKIRDDLDRWDFYRVLEVLHLNKVVSNDDYYELKQLNILRNDIIHDGHEVTKKQASQCYDLAKNIIQKDLNLTQQIKISQTYLGM